jgi:flavorubredoxin
MHGDGMTNDCSTITSELTSGIYRVSTYLKEGPPGGITFNQFLVLGDEPLLFHTGTRQLFPAVYEAVSAVLDPTTICWISSCHASRPDEYGALAEWEAAAPHARPAHGKAGCFLCLSDISSRPLRPLADGELLDLGGRRLRWYDTPHVPGPWEAGVMFEETTQTLFCGDLFSRTGPSEPTTTDDIAEAAIAHDQLMHGHAYTPETGPILRRLAALEPQRLALMHGPTFCGDGAGQLEALASYFDSCLTASAVTSRQAMVGR